MDNTKWLAAQRSALYEAEINPVDVEAIIKTVAAALPQAQFDGHLWAMRGAQDINLAEWVPEAEELRIDVTDATIHDARVEWYAIVPVQYKRILDATH